MNRAFQNRFIGLITCVSVGFSGLLPWGLTQVQAQVQSQYTLSPKGVWQSIDDTTGKPRASIRISQVGDVFTGYIVASTIATPLGAVQVCERCTDERKNQPLIGMEMIRNMRQLGADPLWSGGDILDPDTSKLYRLQLTLQENGKKMQVRGYIGPFFRNQVWLRLE